MKEGKEEGKESHKARQKKNQVKQKQKAQYFLSLKSPTTSEAHLPSDAHRIFPDGRPVLEEKHLEIRVSPTFA